MRSFKALFALAAFAAVAATAAPAPTNADVEKFFKNPRYQQMTLSPDGTKFAALATTNGRRNLAFVDLKDRSKSRFLTAFKKTDIAGYFWKDDSRIVFTLDSDGNESFGLYKIGLDGKPVEILIDAEKLEAFKSAQVIDPLIDISKDEILIQFNQRDIMHPDVYRLNIENGKLTMVARNEDDYSNWGTDHQGKVRLAGKVVGKVTEVLYRTTEKSPWQTLAKFTFPEPTWGPIAFDYDDKTLFVESQFDPATGKPIDMGAIYKYDPEAKKWGERVFARDDTDQIGLMMSRHQKKVTGFNYYTDKGYPVFTEPGLKQVYEDLKAEFAGKEVGIAWNKDETRAVVTAWSDTDPGTYYLFDRKAGALETVAKARDAIDPATQSPHKYVSFKSRDGLTIHGYLTVPKDAKGPVPLIVNPHGGPYGVRDTWGWNPEHQFFASRGYATFQVNYRGSGGYGREFWMAGFQKWGREMQNDLTDAVKWAVAQGIADEKRVCIYGGSYGGYATMAGLTFTPELYRCGINYVGVTDIPLLFTSMPKTWEPQKDIMKLQIGNPDTPEGKKQLEEQSPLNYVDNIKAPVFIVQGMRDIRVVPKHAEMLRDELKERGKPYEWMHKYNEGHGFRKEENRLELYARIDAFLAKNL